MKYKHLILNLLYLVLFLSYASIAKAANLQQQQNQFLQRSSSSSLGQQQRKFLRSSSPKRRRTYRKARRTQRVIRKKRPIISRRKPRKIRKIRKIRKRYRARPVRNRKVYRPQRKKFKKIRIQKKPIYRAKRRLVAKVKQNPSQRFVPKVKPRPEQAPGFVPTSLKSTVNYGLKHIKNNMQWPLIEGASMSRIKRTFGWHSIGDRKYFNRGVDIAAPYDLSVLSAFSGRVLTVGQTKAYGLSVLILHGQGETATRYGNLSRTFVRPGSQVNQRQIIGEVGRSGKLDEPYVSFEYLKRGPTGLQPVDPNPELSISLVRYTQELHLARTKLKN